MTDKPWHLESYNDLHALLVRHVLRDGPYRLSSGLESDWYLDCRGVSFGWPHVVGRALCDYLTFHLNLNPPEIALGGVALGGVPLVTAASLFFYDRGDEVPTCAIREPKSHGVGSGFVGSYRQVGTRPVWVVDDVFTTGSSLSGASNLLLREFFKPAGYTVLVNRNEEMQDLMNWAGRPFHAMYNLADLGIYEGDESARTLPGRANA